MEDMDMDMVMVMNNMNMKNMGTVIVMVMVTATVMVMVMANFLPCGTWNGWIGSKNKLVVYCAKKSTSESNWNVAHLSFWASHKSATYQPLEYEFQ